MIATCGAPGAAGAPRPLAACAPALAPALAPAAAGIAGLPRVGTDPPDGELSAATFAAGGLASPKPNTDDCCPAGADCGCEPPDAHGRSSSPAKGIRPITTSRHGHEGGAYTPTDFHMESSYS